MIGSLAPAAVVQGRSVINATIAVRGLTVAVIKAGDTDGEIVGALTWADTGNPIDLSAVQSVQLVVELPDGTVKKFTASIDDATGGLVGWRYDGSIPGGRAYRCLWLVTWDANAVQRAPASGYLTLTVEADLS